VVITTSSATAPVDYLLSTGTTGRIPDPGSLGVVLPAATAYSWTIVAVAPWASIDDFAGGAAILPTGGISLSESISAGRAFTTQSLRSVSPGRPGGPAIGNPRRFTTR
jgi:hypothetical protein